MRVLVTGATGFLGSLLLPALSEAGHQIVVVSRSAARAKESLPGLTAAYDWSPLDEPPPAEAVRVDAVVHLMGENVAGRWTKSKREAIRASRRDGTRHLVEAIGALPPDQRPKVLISTSAVGLYGDRGEEVITEDTPAGTDFLAEVCVEWEREARVAESLGVRVVRMRLPILLHPSGGALEQMLPMAKMGLGGPLGSGKQWWCWVSVRDVVRFVVDAVADGTFEGAYNVCSPTPVRQREFAKTLGSVLGRPAFLPAPAFALKTVLGAFSAEVLTSKRQIPARLSERGWEFVDGELAPALQGMVG